MAVPSKRAKKTREKSDFDLVRISSELRSPRASTSVFCWSLADIFNARNAQMAGQFALPARMAEAMRTDDALATAYQNRLAPLRCIPVEVKPAKGGKSIGGEANALFGQEGIAISQDTIADIDGCLANHGVAIGFNVWTTREDGSRVDVEHKSWPIEFVRWDAIDRCFKARVDPMGPPAFAPKPTTVNGEKQSYQSVSLSEEPIVHGDGRWVIYKTHENYPWRDEAAILSACLIWARHAFALRDWAKGSVAHGNAKVIGEMPEGVALQDGTGKLTAQGEAFLTLLQAIANGDTPVGIRPAGAKTDFLTNNSTAWQVWNELVLNGDKAAARVYLGTDGTLGAQGGAPGVDIAKLFGVATTRVQGDAGAISRGLQTGLIEPWTAINFGDSSLAPKRVYQIPDEDQKAYRAAVAERRTAFHADVATSKSNGFVITQKYVDDLAEEYDVTAPTLPEETSQKSPTIALAPTDLAAVITVNEARASAGLGPMMLPDKTLDPKGAMMVSAFNAQSTAPPAAAAPEATTSPAPLRSVPSR